MNHNSLTYSEHVVWRIVRPCVAIALLLVLSPLLILLSLLIFLMMGRPLFYREERIGMHQQPFTCIKFRTMQAGKVTALGKFMRTYSLDELPQLWNILKGEMNFIGPRPLPVRYASRMTLEQLRRHHLKPGLTGWAQIHGRNQQTWTERFEFDVWYVQHASLWIDMNILFRSFLVVVQGNGSAAEQHQFMPEFKGVASDESLA